MYTGNELLKINNPCVLFHNDVEETKRLYRELAKHFHPDKSSEGNAGEVFAHVTTLYNKAIQLIVSNKWEIPGELHVESESQKYKIKYLVKHKIEIGDMYIGNNVLVYVLSSNHEKLFNNFNIAMTRFKYTSERMKEEFSRYFPRIKKTFKGKDGSFVIVMEKTEDQFLLHDVIEYYKRTTFPKEWDKHVAWITSRLQNILCYFQFNGIVHNGLSTQSVFISPEFHTVSVYGGWWYSIEYSNKMISVPSNLYNIIPPTVLADKKSKYITDGEFVKYLLRNISECVTMPTEFKHWINYPASNDPKNEFGLWDSVLTKSYGERKFIQLKIEKNELYN